MQDRVLQLLRERRNELADISVNWSSWSSVMKCHTSIRPIMVKHFPDDLARFDELVNIRWKRSPRVMFGDGISIVSSAEASDRATNDRHAKSNHGLLIAHLDAVIELANMSQNPKRSMQEKIVSNQPNTIFIVHGHDNEMKQAVARTLEKLGLTPMILHEHPNSGKTVIEKFERDADVGFAVVLLSPDDMGYLKDEKAKDKGAKNAKPRARENVILELGYFVGSLGRDKVMALKRGDDLEVPSDLTGVVYTPFDDLGAWRSELCKELKAAGYSVDANQL